MRILDFSDGFESNVQPTIEGLPAEEVEFTPAGSIAATDVQAAIEELDADVQAIGTPDLATDVTGTLPIANGGTGQVTANAALNALLPSQATKAGYILQTNATNTSWYNPAPVVARYRLSANRALTANTTPVNYDTSIIDTHSAVTTGASWVFTAPHTGYYCVSIVAWSTSGSPFGMDLYKNSSLDVRLAQPASNVFTDAGTAVVQLNAGETIHIRSSQSVTLDSSGSGAYNQIHIFKVSI
jgi:hypothetical protein